uniref:Vacuolar sorting protein 39/Transforming growth factor beta receptor-associated zinc finger domain-containing protein n=1 Tax=Araucaria cunninghamii TaxID=56994 RepID=A0A0D6R6W1_ARACU
MYLDPGDGKEPMYKAAVRLLHCHGELLDPLQVLEALSPDMPLQLASETLSRMLRARVHHHRQGQIVQSLSRAVNLDARLARFEERSRHVQINDESLCDACHARLGTKLFAMYPNDSLVCYKCFRRYGEHTCPVTGRDFQKDVMFKPSWLVRNV